MPSLHVIGATNSRPPHPPQATYHVDIESIRGKLADWVREPQVAGELRRRFRRFLRTFADEHGEPIYRKRLEEVIKSGWRLPGLD
jgi:hypothetical protein